MARHQQRRTGGRTDRGGSMYDLLGLQGLFIEEAEKAKAGGKAK